MKFTLKSFLFVSLCVTHSLIAQSLETKPNDPYFENIRPLKAPKSPSLMLKKGDRVAICGDSITEQKMYSRIVETYLTVCVPELDITARQYGWSGEKADGFLRRMTNDVLRFHPTVATTCYGMNDHEYRRYEDSIGDKYRQYSTDIIQAFKAHGVRAIQGSPGSIGTRPIWSKDAEATKESSNFSLCQLRNIGIEIAHKEKAGFADVFWPMFQAEYAAKKKFGPDYALAGKDGVHPHWAGQAVMAYAFLKSFGLDGEIGTFTITLGSDKAKTSRGHEIVSFKDGELTIKSSKYPFCATGDPAKDDSIRSAMTLVPFNEELNRLKLVVKGTKKNQNYKVTWGSESRIYTGAQLGKGINLANDFQVNPFSEAFAKVDSAVLAKQTYETKQIKQIFHGPEGQADMLAAVSKTEKERRPLADAIKAAFAPVTHSLKITAE